MLNRKKVNLKNNKYKPTVIDLFCGCGGLSLGFIEADYNVVAGIDNWSDAIETFAKSHRDSIGILSDLASESASDVSEKIGVSKVDVIIGGPPCQGFSIAGKRLIDDDRNKLYKSFVEYVDYFKPSAFVMENVPNIMAMGKGAVKEEIISDFERLGYTVSYQVLLAANYGVPQNRKRAFFVGLKQKGKFIFPEPTVTEVISSEDAISDLPESSIQNGSDYPFKSKSAFQKLMRRNSSTVFNHEITNHSHKTVEIISMVPDGGNYKNLPAELHDTRKVNIAWTRLNSKKPSFTIDTGHRHHFHYKFNRVPTVRESARIQSFPDDFIFYGSKTSQYKQVGNAVPPLLANVIAKELKNYL